MFKTQKGMLKKSLSMVVAITLMLSFLTGVNAVPENDRNPGMVSYTFENGSLEGNEFSPSGGNEYDQSDMVGTLTKDGIALSSGRSFNLTERATITDKYGVTKSCGKVVRNGDGLRLYGRVANYFYDHVSNGQQAAAGNFTAVQQETLTFTIEYYDGHPNDKGAGNVEAGVLFNQHRGNLIHPDAFSPSRFYLSYSNTWKTATIVVDNASLIGNGWDNDFQIYTFNLNAKLYIHKITVSKPGFEPPKQQKKFLSTYVSENSFVSEGIDINNTRENENCGLAKYEQVGGSDAYVVEQSGNDAWYVWCALDMSTNFVNHSRGNLEEANKNGMPIVVKIEYWDGYKGTSSLAVDRITDKLGTYLFSSGPAGLGEPVWKTFSQKITDYRGTEGIHAAQIRLEVKGKMAIRKIEVWDAEYVRPDPPRQSVKAFVGEDEGKMMWLFDGLSVNIDKEVYEGYMGEFVTLGGSPAFRTGNHPEYNPTWFYVADDKFIETTVDNDRSFRVRLKIEYWDAPAGTSWRYQYDKTGEGDYGGDYYPAPDLTGKNEWKTFIVDIDDFTCSKDHSGSHFKILTTTPVAIRSFEVINLDWTEPVDELSAGPGVSAFFDGPNANNNGIKAKPYLPAGVELKTGTYDNRPSWVIGGGSGSTLRKIYCLMDRDYIEKGGSHQVTVLVDYYANSAVSNGGFRLQYDSADTGWTEETPRFNLTATNKWETYMFNVNMKFDETFSSGTGSAQIKGDFTLNLPAEIPIGRITVLKNGEAATAVTSIELENDAMILLPGGAITAVGLKTVEKEWKGPAKGNLLVCLYSDGVLQKTTLISGVVPTYDAKYGTYTKSGLDIKIPSGNNLSAKVFFWDENINTIKPLASGFAM